MPQLYNVTQGTLVAAQLEIPQTIYARMRGLLGRLNLPEGHAMLLKDSGWVHTFFMHFPIDLIFLDRQFKVLKTTTALQPNRFSPFVGHASMTLELPKGAVQASKTQTGDHLRLDP